MQKSESAKAEFLAAYRRLNPSQRQAVDAIEGPVMVIAGPGTGKTQILTLRIANILLKTDTAPENILALTFTNAGAHAMRQRLRSFIGSEAYRVPVFTFHSFAEHLINRYPEAYPTIIGGSAASDLEVIALLEAILENPMFKVLRPAGRPDYYLSAIRSAISDLKKESLSPDRFAGYVATKEKELDAMPRYHETGAHKGKERGAYRDAARALAKNQELAAVYRLYEAGMKEARRYDYDDMVLETLGALRDNDDMRLAVQETYHYVLADEHQDINGSQNLLLSLLTSFHDQPNLFVVGDEKQAIYRFQGASLENFLRFTVEYPKATVITLEENYRSSQAILDLAGTRIHTKDPELAKLRTPLKATTKEPAIMEYHTFLHQALEDAFVVDLVKKQLAEGVRPDEIALIVRKNRQVEYFSRLLQNAGIATSASADTDALVSPLATSVLTLIESIVEPENERALFTLLHESYWNIAPADLWRALSGRTYERPLSAIITDDPALVLIKETLAAARARLIKDAPQQIVARALEESGLRAQVLTHDPIFGGAILRRLYDEIESLAIRTPDITLAEVLHSLRLLKKHHLSLSAAPVPNGGAAVSVMTAHKAKGLEFSVVVMPDMTESAWGQGRRQQAFSLPYGVSLRAPDEDAAYDDEVRLFYVALTRAKRTFYSSYSETGSDGSYRQPARVIDELTAPELKRLKAAGEITTAPALPKLEPEMISVSPAFLKESLLAHGLSATALNNYLSSPWNYLYRNVLRIPEPKGLSQLFGTAMHGVIERAVAAAEAGDPFGDSDTKRELERQLSRLPLSKDEYDRLHARAFSALLTYVPHLSTQRIGERKTEVRLTASLPLTLPDCPEVMLTGTLDRLDFSADGILHEVIDYKTGKVRTRGDIEGTTKTSNGDYKRQLVFYALLLSLQSDERLFACRRMKISFVEPDKNGQIKEEAFSIEDSDIELLKKDIERVVEEIATGSCLALPCDSEKSDYCDLSASLFGTSVV